MGSGLDYLFRLSVRTPPRSPIKFYISSARKREYCVAGQDLDSIRGFGIWHYEESWSSDQIRELLVHLTSHSLDLLSDNRLISSYENIALATFLIAQSVDIDRYTKAMAHTQILVGNKEAVKRRLNLLNAHSRFHSPIKVRNGLYDLAYIPYFVHVPYIRRFKIGRRLYISSENLPGLSDKAASRFCTSLFGNVTIDTMLVDKHSLVFLRVNKWFTGINKCFGATGHFPLLAGYDNQTCRELYVALVHFPEEEVDPWYFTFVEDGASFATYTDEVGQERTTDEFFVLALRHDPSDLPPPYPQACKGAMDPTGPLHWLSFWPKKDPEYFEDKRLKKADETLESMLVGIKEEKFLLNGFGFYGESERDVPRKMRRHRK
ncbi:hypothetical protein SCHPADRAFT_895489 [Schizopora paradoxa]|uniref:Uncharacterized protein n=1 Tax=Schizopora paradoxa TaxID=27342 RepID=A0A0H2R3H8_9AGAM|nr:hypothetical protein SCHPADRAFT_895489 [Schizopora paradoxa]